ncbi:hypothetical protein BKA62DRAFT_770599 [Auriculariales sp. MPI-PUGE-AT-0066]|nr:hypothetical protein BKA62DRAFT_770599 [Auriculariales sp. MPI-PUGE-AT-0066]
MSQKKSSNTAKPGKVVKRGGLKPARAGVTEPILNSTATKLIVSQDSNPIAHAMKSGARSGPALDSLKIPPGPLGDYEDPDFEEESVEEAPSKAEKTGRQKPSYEEVDTDREPPDMLDGSDDSDEQESEMVPRSKKLLPEATLPRVPHKPKDGHGYHYETFFVTGREDESAPYWTEFDMSSSRAQRLKARQQAVVGLDSQAKRVRSKLQPEAEVKNKDDDGRQPEQDQCERSIRQEDFGTAMDVDCTTVVHTSKPGHSEESKRQAPGGPGKSDGPVSIQRARRLTTDIVWTTGRKTKQSASVHARSHKAIQSDKDEGGDEENAAHTFPICDNPLPVEHDWKEAAGGAGHMRQIIRNASLEMSEDEDEESDDDNAHRPEGGYAKGPLTLETKCLIDAAMDRLQAELENIAREACKPVSAITRYAHLGMKTGRRPNSYNLFIKQYTAKYPKGEHETFEEYRSRFAEAYRKVRPKNNAELKAFKKQLIEWDDKYTQEHANEEAEDGYGWKRMIQARLEFEELARYYYRVHEIAVFGGISSLRLGDTKAQRAAALFASVPATKKWLEDQGSSVVAALDQFRWVAIGHRDGEKEVSDYSRKEVNRMISSGSATAKSDLRTRLRRILKSLSSAIMSLPAHSVPWSTFVQTLVNTRMAVLGWPRGCDIIRPDSTLDDTVAQRRQFYKRYAHQRRTQDKHLEGADDPPLPEEQMIRGRELNGDECAILNDPARRSELRSVPLWVNEDGAVLISYADVQGIGDIKNKENPSKTELAEQVTKLHSILATCATNFKHRLIGLKKAPAASDDADSDEHRSVDAVLVTDDSVSHAGGERKRRMEKVVRQSKRAPHPKGDAGDSETTGAATGPKAAMPESRVKLSPAKKSASKSAKLLKSDSSAPTQTSIHSTKPVLEPLQSRIDQPESDTTLDRRSDQDTRMPKRRRLDTEIDSSEHLSRASSTSLAPEDHGSRVADSFRLEATLPRWCGQARSTPIFISPATRHSNNFRRQRSPSFEPDHEIARPIPMHSPQHRHAVPRDFYSTRKQFRRQHFDEDDGLSGDGDEHQYNPYNYRFEPSHSGYGPQSVARHYTGHTRDESRHVPYGSRMPREHWDDHDDSMSRTTNDWHGHRRSRLAGWVSGPDHGSQRARDFPETGGVSHGAAPLFQRAPVRGQPDANFAQARYHAESTAHYHTGGPSRSSAVAPRLLGGGVRMEGYGNGPVQFHGGSMNTGTSNNSNQFGAAVSYVDPVHGPGLPLPSMNASQLGVFNSDPWMLPGVDGLGNQTIPGSGASQQLSNARTHHQIAQSGVSLNNTYGLGAQPHQLPTTASTLEMFSPARSNMSENLSGDAVGPTRPTSALSTFTHASHSIPGTTPLISSSLPSTSGSSSHMASTLNGDSEVLGSPWNEFGAGFGANS